MKTRTEKTGMRRMLVLLLAVALTAALCGCSGGTAVGAKSGAGNLAIISGKIDADGTAYLPVMDGTTVTIPGDVYRAVLLKDRATIVVLEKDGLLYTTTVSAPGEKTTVAENVAELSYTGSTGLTYKDGKGEFFRYLFADGSTVSLGKNISCRAGTDSLSVLLADDQGKIYLMPQDATEPEKIGSFEDVFAPEAVSSDGKTAVWMEKDTDAGTHTTCVYTGENRIRLGEVNSKYNSVYPQFNSGESFLAIADTYGSDLSFLNIGDEEITTVKLGNELYSSTIYTKNGQLRYDTAQTIDGLYVLVEADSNASIYYISMDGDREKVVGNVTDMATAGGRLYYLDGDKNLYTAKLNGSELQEETRVAGDVSLFQVSRNGNYAYYLKNVEGNTGTLSRYNATKGESEKVSANAYSYIGSYWSIAYFYVSEDGKTVYFFEDIEQNVGDTYSDTGTLKCATEGADSVKIATDVITGRPYSGLREDWVNAKGFAFEKYISTDGDGNLMVNWMYFNGTESQTIAKEVYHDSTVVTSSVAETEAVATEAASAT